MGFVKEMAIPQEMLQAVIRQAEREYPSECCGMILGPSNVPEALTRLRPCRNTYDEHHVLDPDNFPRTSKTAYFMAPQELLAIQKELRTAGEEIRIIYHSHINTGAYFSQEDIQVALAEGEPAYPGVKYWVLSVMEGKVTDHRLYHWDSQQRTFLS